MSGQILIDGQLYDSETGELINEVEQVEVEIIENSLPEIVCKGGTHIKTNTEQLKRELISYLEKYDIEVTEDTEKECSKMATELNKIASNLDKKRKETASIIKKPADDLKLAVDELIKIIQDKRTNLLNGVNIFKEQRMNFIKSMLELKIFELYEAQKVSERYRVCDITPLILEGSLSKTNLTKKAIESLEAMVTRVKMLETTVMLRETQLSLKCIESNLITPLTLDDVSNIIELDNYDVLLDDMIQHRLNLEQQIKQRQEQAEQLKIKQQEEQEERERILKNEKELELQKTTGKKKVRINVTFEIEVNSNIDSSSVFIKYDKKLRETFSTISEIKLL